MRVTRVTKAEHLVIYAGKRAAAFKHLTQQEKQIRNRLKSTQGASAKHLHNGSLWLSGLHSLFLILAVSLDLMTFTPLCRG